ncbi:hypothetical protein EVG20_g2221 [Dentipellis fragilis]|uniref:Uncharacterized protein n=1 Tax=Dentipellis fragilis TaxID=205917 RepID=A0A4Y9Z9H5_9AGAM|nr:hypothetical protein EVG20_g2221 [Dentipellis fragilis]
MIRVLEDPSALDVAAEAVALVSRAQELTQRTGTDDPESIAKAWFKFTPHEPWVYRKELNEFAQPGTEWHFPDWEIEIWDRKVDLRAEWRALVSSGEAEEWVRGVGEGGSAGVGGIV